MAVSLDGHRKMTYVNESFLQLTGYSRDAILGQDWFDVFIPEKQREEVKRIFFATVQDKSQTGSSRFENHMPTKGWFFEYPYYCLDCVRHVRG